MNKVNLFQHSIDTLCKSPLKAIDYGINPITGKKNIQFLNKITLAQDPLGYISACQDKGLKVIDIPCGHCISCRLRRSKDWANRMMLEASQHKQNWFLTLTYNDEHLPPRNPIPDEDGVVVDYSPIHSLDKRDVQLFIKRLRKALPDQHIMYYCSGEYGSLRNRPHYHLILFGLELPKDDLYIPPPGFGKAYNELDQKYYCSKLIDKIWTDSVTGNSKGIHIIAECTWETCAYVARYVTKKLFGEKSKVYDELQYEPEFSLMSTKPAIGKNYFLENVDKIYLTDEVFVKCGHNKGRRVRPPRYFDKLADLTIPLTLSYNKANRELVMDSNSLLSQNADSLDEFTRRYKHLKSLNKRYSMLKVRNRNF